MKKFQLTWNPSRHALGIASIDSQHRELIDMVNELVEAVLHACDCELALGYMANIIHFTEEHFIHEEELMRQYDFPGRQAHEVEHKEVLRQAIMMMETLKPDDTNRAVLLAAFLTDCAENHILHDDRALGLYLQKKGLS